MARGPRSALHSQVRNCAPAVAYNVQRQGEASVGDQSGSTVLALLNPFRICISAATSDAPWAAASAGSSASATAAATSCSCGRAGQATAIAPGRPLRQGRGAGRPSGRAG